MPAMRLLPCFLAYLPLCFSQAPPCGRAVVTVGGSAREEKFLEAPPDHVKACVLRALPVLAAKVSQETEFHVEAKTDGELYRTLRTKNKEAGVGGVFHRGTGAFGTFLVDLRPDTGTGMAGTRLTIQFHKNSFKGRAGSSAEATPLMDEVSCLVTSLSPLDPIANPRGIPAAPAAAIQAVELPEGTPFQVLLREFLYSKKVRSDQPITLEVAGDVVVNGVTVIRRGALATGKYVDARRAAGRSRAGQLAFVVQHVIAVDGQSVPVAGAVEKSRGNRAESSAERAYTYARLGWLELLNPGVETLIRAGSSYEVETFGTIRIQGVK